MCIRETKAKTYLYMITGKLKAGNFALNTFANQMLKNRHIAQTADCEELYCSFDPTGVVCFLAWIPDHIPRSPTADPIHIPVVLSRRVWKYFALGIIAMVITEIIATR
jgi:hypothetical protein